MGQAWHALVPGEVERLLDTGGHGLGAVEVRARLARYGLNQLEEEPPPPPVLVCLRQFRSPLIFILLAALAVTVLLGEHLDASVIAAVLALNAVMGFTQERKAEGAVRFAILFSGSSPRKGPSRHRPHRAGQRALRGGHDDPGRRASPSSRA